MSIPLVGNNLHKGQYLSRHASRRHWSHERILAALVQFHSESQRWPETYDFHPRVRVAYLPCLCTVWRLFGGLDLACHAAELALTQPTTP